MIAVHRKMGGLLAAFMSVCACGGAAGTEEALPLGAPSNSAGNANEGGGGSFAAAGTDGGSSGAVGGSPGAAGASPGMAGASANNPLGMAGSPEVPLDPALQAACEHLAEVWCGRFGACAPSNLEIEYGTDASCRAADALTCERIFMVGPEPDTADIDSMSDRLETMPCHEIVDSLYQRDYTITCEPLPALQDHVGEPCNVSMMSDGVTSVGCDTTGLICDLANMKCVLPPEVGDPCFESSPDFPSLSADPCPFSVLQCQEGVCVAPLFFGEPCTPEDDRCSVDAGLFCNADSVCDVLVPAHVEGQCGGYVPNPGSCGTRDICRDVSNLPPGVSDAPGVCELKTTVFGSACTVEGYLDDCPVLLSCIDGTCQISGGSLACSLW